MPVAVVDHEPGEVVDVELVLDNVPIDVIVGRKKVVDVDRHYNAERLRPIYHSFNRQPIFIMTSDV
ncbi:MAG: hypothetical protein ACLFRX_06435 [Gemmatimonadota bacterium]